ncbi:hypothetical protein A3D78_06220 [Candidatus Gottesmanbacteria bacterium RIFCSPHIGHO2_02_FULL_39_14]|uniref:Uncharacterized protein n=2 Tax=Candidatus Gottesmaniibacteriota TaxID=1752720 RepID=A0A1F6A4Z1_9BACT|nr:MAG: hypothetical protein A3D78_06220 [Candidatus Gottesmanbacteria bacterium RIFCSPHIGHO2_02_FULL_39_14]OGG32438.1 MAG: hypothetical protein A3I51_02620 [Candidatus Gottesmanbacteria bacterium RIFCSPLOWO2_02_FULL_38_8]
MKKLEEINYWKIKINIWEGNKRIRKEINLKVFNPPSRKSPAVRPWDAETFFRFGRISAPDEVYLKNPRPLGSGSFNNG